MTDTFPILVLQNLLVSHVYGFSSSNRTKMPFNDLQGVLNDQFHVVSNLFTPICLCWSILSYNRAILWYLSKIPFARVGRVTISYSKDMSEILYLVSGEATVDLITRLQSLVVIL